MAFTYFTIFGAMRTGSNLLERSLDQYDGLAAHGELYNPHFIGKPERREFMTIPLAERNADPIGLLEKLIEATPDVIPGFRIFDNHDPRVIDYAIRDPRCAKIILTRNPVDSFISLQIAQETGQWMLMKDENRRLAKMRFEPAQYERYLEKRAAHYAGIRRAAQDTGQSVFEVDYEDLSEISVLNGVAAFIGSAEVKTAAPDKIRRQNPPAWEDKVENVEDLRAYVAGGAPAARPDPEPSPKFGALGEMVASKDFGAIYAPLPGAGAAEFRRFLTEAAGAAGADAPRLAEGLKEKHLIRRRWRGAFVFSFVRHPAERLHDVFLHRIAREDAGDLTMVQMMMTRDYGAPSPQEMMMSADALLAGFDAFLSFVGDNLAGRTALRPDPAWTPQSTLLAEFSRETPLDFIGRVDRLEEDTAYLLSRLEIDAPDLIAKLKTAFSRSEALLPRDVWLTRAREEAIRALHARDYDRLGYGFLSD